MCHQNPLVQSLHLPLFLDLHIYFPTTIHQDVFPPLLFSLRQVQRHLGQISLLVSRVPPRVCIRILLEFILVTFHNFPVQMVVKH